MMPKHSLSHDIEHQPRFRVSVDDKKRTKQLHDEYEAAIRRLLEQEKSTDTQFDAWLKLCLDNNCLTFRRKKDADHFFQSLADENMPFISFAIDGRGNHLGGMYFSAGDGQLFKPSLSKHLAQSLEERWQEIHKHDAVAEMVYAALQNKNISQAGRDAKIAFSLRELTALECPGDTNKHGQPTPKTSTSGKQS